MINVEDILLAAAVIAFFVIGFYLLAHLDRFADRICLSFQRPQEPENMISITGTGEKSTEMIDPQVIDNIVDSGFTVKYDL